MGPGMVGAASKAFKHPIWRYLGGLGLLLLGLAVVADILAEGLWFQDLNYLGVFWLRLKAQVGLGVVAFMVSLGFIGGNIAWARRHADSAPPSSTAVLGLRSLLAAGLGLGLLIGIQLLYHGHVAASHWQPSNTLYTGRPPLPLWAKPASALEILRLLGAHPWQIIALVITAIAVVIYPQGVTLGTGLLMSLGFGAVLSGQWTQVLPALKPVPFEQSDPLFHQDIGTYIFYLPLGEVLNFWLLGMCFFTVVAVLLVYLLPGNTLSRGQFFGFTLAQKRHLYGLASVLLLCTSFNHWLARYQLLFSSDGVVYGASYTDIHVSLPVNTALAVITAILGLGLLWRSLFWGVSLRALMVWLKLLGQGKLGQLPAIPYIPMKSHPILWGVVGYLLLALVGTLMLPPLVQRLIVQPNELERETPYIERAIALTRSAFDLDDIDVEPFVPTGSLTTADLERNHLTLDNVRLWDTRPLLESNRQLQEIRLYYEFRDADVDRYLLRSPDGSIDRRQVLISARELNYTQVPDIAKTWVNEHLVYTHGYGFTMSPVNTANPDGLPAYFIKGIDHTASSDTVRDSVPVGNPQIYFGELTNTYIMTDTEVRELDYPSGADNVYTRYQGQAGIALGNYWQRLLFAKHLGDWRMLFTADFTADTQLLYRRTIMDRVRTLAPFLRFDQDPYLVVADIGDTSLTWGTDPNPSPKADTAERHTLFWIVDAYTTSDRYPYSDPGGNDFNYIRNSVKVLVDAYHGTVGFFMADADDPMIQTWSRLLPGMFHPLADIPPTVRSHLRYPQDLFQVQSDQLMTYHMSDPQVFYNREDQWRAPNEIYADEAQPVEPYYLIMKLPQEDTEEFILLRLFTPVERNNLVAWLAARSDGDRYGRRLLYQFPKQELVFGPEQIEARINQDPAISQRISLWNTQGSRAQQGNLLVIPIEQSLLYVEPLYLVAEQTPLPSLARVIVVYQNRIAMADTLEDGLAAIFESEPEQTPVILRELDNIDDLFTPGDTQTVPGITPEPSDNGGSQPPD